MRARPIAPVLVLAAVSASAAAQAPTWVAFGSSAFDAFGVSISLGGDYDGDAVPDLVVGAPQFQSGASYVGRVQILSGATGAVVRSFQGGTHEGLGVLVAAVRDLDGDAVPDVVAALSGLATVRVLSGASGAVVRTHTGSIFHAFGAQLSGLGDVNGDGSGDYAIGAPTEGPTGSGVVRVYSGVDGSVLHTYVGTGTPNGTVLRGVVVDVGDLDADARDEFALVHTATPGSNEQGRVSVHSGASGAEILSFLGALHTSFGDAALLGDLDGDGVRELAVGQGTGGNVPGRVVAYSLATGAIVRTFPSPQPGTDDRFGGSVAALADVDLDGVTDVAVAGSAPRGAWVYSGATGALLQSYQRGGNCAIGLRVEALPDVDLDGRAELALAEPCADYGAPPFPRVGVYSGATSTDLGALSCFGDGTSAPCPCSNPGASGVGCANTTGAGASLRAHGSTSVARDDLWLEAAGLPGNAGGSTYLFASGSVSGGGFGIQHFGGVRCVNGLLRRLGQHDWKGAGVASWASGLQPAGAWGAGMTRHFQAMYRDVTNPCSQANFTNVTTLTLTP